jgi:ankyrin repeat protein
MNDRRSTLALLIARGASVNTKGRNGMTPLLYAAARGHSETGIALLEAGADPTATSKDKESALGFAVGSKTVPLIQELVARGADPLAKNKYGATPLERGAHVPAIALILQGAKPLATKPKKKK